MWIKLKTHVTGRRQCFYIEGKSRHSAASICKLRSHKKSIQKKRITFSLNDYVSEIISGNGIVLSQAITLVKSALQKHYNFAQKIIEWYIPHSGNYASIGTTTVHWVGRSTFIEVFGKYITGHGRKLAVLTIDTSSEIFKEKANTLSLSLENIFFING